jgi:hypothetical protein
VRRSPTKRIIFALSCKAKPSPHRCRTPGFLRIAPIDSRQQITKLGRRYCHHSIGHRRPQKTPTLQALRKQACSLAVMPNHLHQIASTSAEAKQVSAQGIAAQHFLHLQRQARKASPHVGMPGRQPNFHAGRYRDHRPSLCERRLQCRRSRTSSTRPSAAALTSLPTITRCAPPRTITICPEPARSEAASRNGAHRSSIGGSLAGSSGATIAGTNPATAPHRPSRYALRQANSSAFDIPFRRAVADTNRGAEKLSSTIRSFSSSVQRRRRPVSTISRRLTCRLSVRISIPTVSYRPHKRARRLPPSAYFVPAVIEPALAPVRQPKSVRSAKRYPKSGGAVGIVELEIAGVTIRVGSGAPVETIAAVICALRAGA